MAAETTNRPSHVHVSREREVVPRPRIVATAAGRRASDTTGVKDARNLAGPEDRRPERGSLLPRGGARSPPRHTFSGMVVLSPGGSGGREPAPAVPSTPPASVCAEFGVPAAVVPVNLFLSRATGSLHFAVRPTVVATYLGLLMMLLAGLTLVPATVGVLSGQEGVAWRYALVIAGLIAIGWPCSRFPRPSTIQRNEALVVTALVFALSSLAMSFPLLAYGLRPSDALFEAVSGVTTTGLSTLGSIEGRPWAFLFSRAWLQWVGGLGVVVLALAMLIRPGTAARRLGFARREMDEVAGGTRAHAKRVLLVYVILTAAGVALAWVSGATLRDAMTHVLAAVSTGGFSTHDESLAGIASPLARAMITVVCLAGAMSFSWYYVGLYRRPRELLSDVRFRSLLAMCLVTGLLLQGILILMVDRPPLQALGHGLLMGVSAQTTAGFSSVSVPDLPDAAKLVLICSMMTGGAVGSTAGGIKIFRFLAILLLVTSLFRDVSTPPSTRLRSSFGDLRFDAGELRSALGVVFAYVIVVLLSWFAFLLYGHAPLDSLFEVASATATAGLSSGVVGPDLCAPLKGVLCIDMLMGRVEVVAALIFFFPPTWIGRRRS